MLATPVDTHCGTDELRTTLFNYLSRRDRPILPYIVPFKKRTSSSYYSGDMASTMIPHIITATAYVSWVVQLPLWFFSGYRSSNINILCLTKDSITNFNFVATSLCTSSRRYRYLLEEVFGLTTKTLTTYIHGYYSTTVESLHIT